MSISCDQFTTTQQFHKLFKTIAYKTIYNTERQPKTATMFAKLRNKYNDRSPSTSRSRRSSDYSNVGRSTVDIPALVTPTPRPSTSSEDESLPSYRSRSMSRTNYFNARAVSTPGDINREQTNDTLQPARSRWRDIFWKNGLWNSKHNSPKGAHVRPKSQSVTLPHPSVVEEQMRRMPHHDWQGRNKPDGVWDDANVMRLYG